tara:strand:- start:1924 stop:2685 length:762 start_codon:yes stop_codon:yes gene_type:complete
MKHMVIPDTQVKPGCPIDHLKWAGQYAVDKKPDVIVHIGDHWDMPSLSHYDKGTKSFEGRRYTQDIAAGIAGMEEFLAPIRAEQRRLKVNKHKQWNPRLVFTLGNHENRITRAIESDPKLDGLIGFSDLRLEEMGWEVVPFLAPIKIDGVVYAHYFTSGIMGRPVSSSRALLTKQFQSCVMGHVQDRELSFAKRADGTRVTGLFAGIFYQHEEGYLNAQTNLSWRGIWMLHEVDDGAFDEMPVSLNYLRKRYG